MAEVTNGQQIATILNVEDVVNGVPSGDIKSYSVLMAFGSYSAITTAEYARLAESNRENRVAAFMTYIQNTYYNGENIAYQNEHRQENTSACPINGLEIPLTQIYMPDDRRDMTKVVGEKVVFRVEYIPDNSTSKAVDYIKVGQWIGSGSENDLTAKFDVALTPGYLEVTLNSITGLDGVTFVEIAMYKGGVKINTMAEIDFITD